MHLRNAVYSCISHKNPVTNFVISTKKQNPKKRIFCMLHEVVKLLINVGFLELEKGGLLL